MSKVNKSFYNASYPVAVVFVIPPILNIMTTDAYVDHNEIASVGHVLRVFARVHHKQSTKRYSTIARPVHPHVLIGNTFSAKTHNDMF